jgi:hypothetical protein
MQHAAPLGKNSKLFAHIRGFPAHRSAAPFSLASIDGFLQFGRQQVDGEVFSRGKREEFAILPQYLLGDPGQFAGGVHRNGVHSMEIAVQKVSGTDPQTANLHGFAEIHHVGIGVRHPADRAPRRWLHKPRNPRAREIRA